MDYKQCYYIKVSCILSGSKLIKTISHMRGPLFYSHMCDVIFDNIFVPLTALKLVNLVYDQNIFGSSSEVFGSLQKMFGNICLAFRQMLKNVQKSSANYQKGCYVL